MTKPAYNQRHEDWRPERPEPIRLPSGPRPPEEWKRIYAEIEKAMKLEAERRTKSAPVKLEESLPIYEGTCLLLDHPLEAGKIDGDTVNVKVLYDGHFTYQTVLGATRTVRAFWALP